jgi:hypothetical protein
LPFKRSVAAGRELIVKGREALRSGAVERSSV